MVAKAKTYDGTDYTKVALKYANGKTETVLREELGEWGASDLIEEEGLQNRGERLDTIAYNSETKTIVATFKERVSNMYGGAESMNVFQPAEDAECALPKHKGAARKSRKASRKSRKRKASRKNRK